MSDDDKTLSECDMNVSQWAGKRNMSVPTAHKILNGEYGPETFEVPGIRGKHISPAADAAWEKRMQQLSKSKEVRRAAAQRKRAAQHAGTFPRRARFISAAAYL